jgi:hypothetical protein
MRAPTPQEAQAVFNATDLRPYVAPVPEDIHAEALKARRWFDLLTDAEIEQDIRSRAAAIRRDLKLARRVTPGAEQAMRKMLTEELGIKRVRYPTVVTLHCILSRLESLPNAPISQYDASLGDEKTIRGLQHVLANAGYLTQASTFYGNGKATMQAFKGSGKPRGRVKLIPSETYWDGFDEYLSYGNTAESPWPSNITDADVPY